MVWPLVSAAGFVLATVIVIVLARAGTARWEQERAAEDEEIRRRRARQRARSVRSGMVVTSSVHRHHRDRPRGSARPSRRGSAGPA
jgi:hypothetical protein